MDLAIERLALALSIGLLVGLERGWKERDAPEGSRTGGIRTFGISGLLGGAMAALSRELSSPLLLACSFITFAIIFCLFRLREAMDDDDYSVTSVIAALCVFGFGAMAVAGSPTAAAAGGTSLAALLASRDFLHAFLKRLTWPELRSALLLAFMTAVVLPLLPDREIGGIAAVNPFQVWLFTVLTATISFIGYIAVRLFGEREGRMIAAAAGALVSSTAVTLTLARSANGSSAVRQLVGAACLAASISIVRVLFLAAVISPAVLPKIALAATTGVVTFVFGSWFFARCSSEAADVSLKPENPFEVRSLALFAAIFVATLMLSEVLTERFGTPAVPFTSAIAGSFDVDVAVLTALRRTRQIGPDVVAQAILSAMAANALGKVALAGLLAPARFSARFAAVCVLAITLGCVAFAPQVSHHWL